jgi:putative membrane protein
MTTDTPSGALSDPSTDLSARRTGMSFQRTRLAADRTLMAVLRTSLSLISFGFTIFNFFQKLREAGTVEHAAEPRHFGMALVVAGIVMLSFGIIYHLQFMSGLRDTRDEMIADHLIHGQSKYPPSFTLVTALVLLLIGLFAIISMVFNIGPF